MDWIGWLLLVWAVCWWITAVIGAIGWLIRWVARQGVSQKPESRITITVTRVDTDDPTL